jgi:hypothetical protein
MVVGTWREFLTEVQLSSLLLRTFVGLLYQLWMTRDDDDDCKAIGGMRGWQENRSTRRKPDPQSQI